MNSNVGRVFSGWLKLTEEERRELDAEINKFKRNTASGQHSIEESVRKVYTGPLSAGTCPCCGR